MPQYGAWDQLNRHIPSSTPQAPFGVHEIAEEPLVHRTRDRQRLTRRQGTRRDDDVHGSGAFLPRRLHRSGKSTLAELHRRQLVTRGLVETDGRDDHRLASSEGPGQGEYAVAVDERILIQE